MEEIAFSDEILSYKIVSFFLSKAQDLEKYLSELFVFSGKILECLRVVLDYFPNLPLPTLVARGEATIYRFEKISEILIV